MVSLFPSLISEGEGDSLRIETNTVPVNWIEDKTKIKIANFSEHFKTEHILVDHIIIMTKQQMAFYYMYPKG